MTCIVLNFGELDMQTYTTDRHQNALTMAYLFVALFNSAGLFYVKIHDNSKEVQSVSCLFFLLQITMDWVVCQALKNFRRYRCWWAYKDDSL